MDSTLGELFPEDTDVEGETVPFCKGVRVTFNACADSDFLGGITGGVAVTVVSLGEL